MSGLVGFILSAFNEGGYSVEEEARLYHVALSIIEFVDFMRPLEDIAVAQGFKRGIVTAQVAQETYYGRKVIDKNLFNIKAGSGWNGRRVWTWTHEYIDGKMTQVKAWFRAYDTYEDSVKNYISLIKNADRYKETWINRDDIDAYFDRLHRAGYATDPVYAANCIDRYGEIRDIV